MKKIILILFGVLLFVGCSKNELDAGPGDFKNGYFILNEGTFNFGNASLDFYQKSNDSLLENLYFGINHTALGDVAQHMIKTPKYLLIVVNNSQKIEVLDIKTLKRIRTISGFDSPRYIHLIDSNKALVTELYSKKIHLVNFETGAIEHSQDAFGWSERMIQIQNAVWIQIKKHPTDKSNKKGFVVYDISTGAFNQIDYNDEPISHLFAKNNLWVLGKKEDSSFHLIGHNYTDMDLLPNKIDFTAKEDPRYLVFDNTQSLYYYNSKKIWRVDISNPNLPLKAEVFVDVSHLQNVYNIQWYDQSLFVFDAKNYTQKGTIEQYNPQGIKIRTIKAGIIPHEII